MNARMELLPKEAAAAIVTLEQVELIKRTVAKDATADELKLYFYDCARQGVHPLDKLIHFTKRSGKYTPVTSIDFMRIQAHATGECLGISDPTFTESFEVNAKYPASATVTVRRYVQGQVGEFTATARWAEYKPDQAFMWMKMPHTMLGKCAEALALRKGFPKQLAGLYAREEMDQAGGTDTHQPSPAVEAVTTVIEGKAVNTLTGEVVPEDGLLRVKGVQSQKTARGRTCWLITFSDGRSCYTFKEQESALAEKFAQESTAIVLDVKVSPRGLDLVSIASVAAEAPPAQPAEGAAAPEPPVHVSAVVIPF